jgi:hypothetical protein
MWRTARALSANFVPKLLLPPFPRAETGDDESAVGVRLGSVSGAARAQTFLHRDGVRGRRAASLGGGVLRDVRRGRQEQGGEQEPAEAGAYRGGTYGGGAYRGRSARRGGLHDILGVRWGRLHAHRRGIARQRQPLKIGIVDICISNA